MPSPTPKTSTAEIKPRELFEVINLGTGCDFSMDRLKAFMKKNPKRACEVIRQTRQYLKESTGHTIDELTTLTPEGIFPKTENYREVRTNIRDQLLTTTTFLSRYGEESKESGLRRTGREANAYIKAQANYYFPGEDSLETLSKVETCNEAEYLVLMAFNDNADPKLKFQAALKLLLMKYIGEIRNYTKKDENHDQALRFMNNTIDDRLIVLPDGMKMGGTTARYLVSFHEAEQDYETVETVIVDEKPDDETIEKLIEEIRQQRQAKLESGKSDMKPENVTRDTIKITHLESHKASVIDKNGQNRIVPFTMRFREKADESRLIKALRYGAEVGERDVDRNGIEFTFEKLEDWRAFLPTWLQTVKEKNRADLIRLLEKTVDPAEIEVLRERLAKINDSVKIDKETEKDTLEGGSFNGNDISSSSKLKVHKFTLRVKRADGRWHHYEVRAFLPNGYADTMYRKGVSWEEYHVNRFFRAQVDQMFFPEHIYPGIDRKKAHEKVLERAHKKMWPNHSESTLPSPNEENERGDKTK